MSLPFVENYNTHKANNIYRALSRLIPIIKK